MCQSQAGARRAAKADRPSATPPAEPWLPDYTGGVGFKPPPEAQPRSKEMMLSLGSQTKQLPGRSDEEEEEEGRRPEGGTAGRAASEAASGQGGRRGQAAAARVGACGTVGIVAEPAAGARAGRGTSIVWEPRSLPRHTHECQTLGEPAAIRAAPGAAGRAGALAFSNVGVVMGSWCCCHRRSVAEASWTAAAVHPEATACLTAATAPAAGSKPAAAPAQASDTFWAGADPLLAPSPDA